MKKLVPDWHLRVKTVALDANLDLWELSPIKLSTLQAIRAEPLMAYPITMFWVDYEDNKAYCAFTIRDSRNE